MMMHAPPTMKPVRKAPHATAQARRGSGDRRGMALNSAAAVQRLSAMRRRANAAREPAQRVLMAGLNQGPGLSQQADDKMQSAAGALNRLGANVVPNIVLTLANIDTGGTNPAVTRYDANAGTIDVDVQNWYLELASSGELLGMLTHEIGVHSLADAEMTVPQTTAETNTNHLDTQVDTGTRTFDIEGEQNNDRRSMDHVNAVKLQAVNTLRARGQRYLDTFLRMGDAIENDPNLNAGEKTVQQRDLQDTFLFDIGRIVATDDGGAIRGLAGVPGAVAKATSAIADVMNWYRTTFLVPQYGAHAWLNQPALQNAWNGPKVALMLVDKLVDYGVSRVKGSSTSTKMLLGATGVGATALGIAFAPVTTLALGGLGLVYGAYRWFRG